MPRDRLNVVDLFTGCGALSAGFMGARNADYRIVCANEIDQAAADSFKINHPDATMIVQDARGVDASEIESATSLPTGEIDVVIGGPPCQGFSTAGKRWKDDPRNDLVMEFARLACEIRPRVAVMENVPQFLRDAGGIYWKAFRDYMRQHGYHTEAGILTASDYGVPQARRRAFCISIELDLLEDGVTFPAPTHQRILDVVRLQRGDRGGLTPDDADLKKFVSIGNAIGDLPSLGPEENARTTYRPGGPTAYQKERRKKRSVLTEHEYWNHGMSLLSYIGKIPEGSRMIDYYGRQEWKGSGFRQAYARLHRNGVGHTITTSFHNPGSGRFTHYRDNRAISIREAARLQGFDDDYVFVGTKAQKKTQVGNAVPPLLARSVAEHVYETIFRTRVVPAIVPAAHGT